MICVTGGFVIQRHNELRDLEAEPQNMVYKDLATEQILQDVEGEQLRQGTGYTCPWFSGAPAISLF